MWFPAQKARTDKGTDKGTGTCLFEITRKPHKQRIGIGILPVVFYQMVKKENIICYRMLN